MAPIRQLGVSPHELDAIVAHDHWKQWCTAEPVLNEVSGLHELRTLRGEREDPLLGALVRLASRTGGDDQLAAIAVTHQLGGSIRSIATLYWRMTDEDIEEIVTATMWAEIRSFDWRRHTEHFGGSLTHSTRRAVRRLLTSGHCSHVDQMVIPVDPQTGIFDALAEHAARGTTTETNDPREELRRLLRWAVEQGHLQEDEVSLLLRLVAADRDNPTITKWMRGACSVAALAQVAAEQGVCAKSIARARNRALGRLRQVAPTYLQDVA